MKISDKDEIVRMIEDRSSHEFYDLVEPIIHKGTQTLRKNLKFDEVTAEEVVIKAVEKAIGKIHLYDPSKGTFNTWMSKIIHNQALDHLRKGYSPPLSLDELHEKGITFSVNEEEIEEEPDIIMSAEFLFGLSELSSLDREILDLTFFKGLSDLETADKLNIEYSACRKRKERALKRFREILIKYPKFKKLEVRMMRQLGVVQLK